MFEGLHLALSPDRVHTLTEGLRQVGRLGDREQWTQDQETGKLADWESGSEEDGGRN